jgi:hypothetical protein
MIHTLLFVLAGFAAIALNYGGRLQKRRTEARLAAALRASKMSSIRNGARPLHRAFAT